MKSFKTFLLEDRPDPEFKDIDAEGLMQRIIYDIDDLKETYINIKTKEDSLFLHDFLIEEHYDDYMSWAKRNFSEFDIEEQEKHINESAFRKFLFDNEDLVNNWLLKNDSFISWAEERLLDQDSDPDPDFRRDL